MSVAFQTNSSANPNRIRSPGFGQGMWIYNSLENSRFAGDVDHRSSKFTVDNDNDNDEHDSSSLSSIGNNSDSDDDGGGDGEVQSSFKGSLNNLCDLEDALPIKRGISTFYAGKSKSYTSLADAVSVPSIQDIVKPEDAYNRKRKNILAHTVLLDKNRNLASKSGISKRLANFNRGESSSPNSSLNSTHGDSLPPLPARPKRLPNNEIPDSSPRIYSSPWRSFSLSDLQHAAGATSSSLGNKRDEEEDQI